MSVAIIKKECADFLVDEVFDTSLLQDQGTSIHAYILKKQNYTTERAVTHVAKALHIPRKFIGYAGTKDKHAITTQLISIQKANKEKVDLLDLKDIELEFKGYLQQRLQLGDLKGNRFTIVLRNFSGVLFNNFPSSFFVPNYFDTQRFSTNNVAIGTFILKREFKEACQLVVETDNDYGSLVQEHLTKVPTDFVGALKRIPKKSLLFYIHAVQSKLFNDLLSNYVQSIGETNSIAYSEGFFSFTKQLLTSVDMDKQLSLVGYETESFPENSLGLTARDFLIRQFPEFSLEGDVRNAFIEVQECVCTKQDLDVVEVSFILPKGAYATIVLKQLFGDVQQFDSRIDELRT